MVMVNLWVDVLCCQISLEKCSDPECCSVIIYEYAEKIETNVEAASHSETATLYKYLLGITINACLAL